MRGMKAFPYQCIAADLRKDISTGQLKPGDKLPSLNRLSDRYEVSPATVQRAMDVLKRDRLIVSEPGRGSFVRTEPLVRRDGSRRHLRVQRPSGTRPFDAEAQREGQQGKQEILHIQRVMPPADVAFRLRVDEAEEVLLCRYLLRADDAPVAIVNSYYRLELVRGTLLETAAHAGISIDVYLMDELGLSLDHFTEELQACLAGDVERTLLALGPDEPVVIRILRTLYDADGASVQVSDQCLAGDKYVLLYDIPIG